MPSWRDGAFAGFAQEGFQLGERLLDWVQVGAAGRQDEQLCALAATRSASRVGSLPRAVAVIAAQGPCRSAHDAAATAPSTSCRRPCGMRAQTSPVQGLPLSSQRLPAGSTQAPSMKRQNAAC